MRMVFADHVADDTGALDVRPVPGVVELAHRIKNAAMYRLEAVSRVRKCAAHDHAHGVIQIRTAHLVFEIDA